MLPLRDLRDLGCLERRTVPADVPQDSGGLLRHQHVTHLVRKLVGRCAPDRAAAEVDAVEVFVGGNDLDVLRPNAELVEVDCAVGTDRVDPSLVLGAGQRAPGPWPVLRRVVGYGREPFEVRAQTSRQTRGYPCRADPPGIPVGGDDDEVTAERAVAILEKAAAEQAGLARQRDPGVLHEVALRRDAGDDSRDAGAGEHLAGDEPALAGSRAHGCDLDLVGEPADGGERTVRSVRPDQLEVIRQPAREIDREDELAAEGMVIDADRAVEAGGHRRQLHLVRRRAAHAERSDNGQRRRDSPHRYLPAWGAARIARTAGTVDGVDVGAVTSRSTAARDQRPDDPRCSLGEPYAGWATAASLRNVNVSRSRARSTTIWSPSLNFPARISSASGFSTMRWIVRLSGRAPKTGSYPL